MIQHNFNIDKAIHGLQRNINTKWKIEFGMRGSRNFRQGGGGVKVSLTKKSADGFFCFVFSGFFYFIIPQPILQKSNGQFQRNLSFFKVPEVVQHFPGGGGSNSFRGGRSNCLFPKLGFSRVGGGGSGPPVPPLDPPLFSPKKEVKLQQGQLLKKV